jgi:hypothetical protein
MIARENEDDHIRSAFEEEAKIDTGTALEEISSEPANVDAGVEVWSAEGFGRRSH